MTPLRLSGEIVEIKRGEKRKLLEIKILADKKVEYETFNKYSVSDLANLSEASLKERNFKVGHLASDCSKAVWYCGRSGSNTKGHSYLGLRFTPVSS
ncbi:MAG: hypothetical protein U5K54_22990 [Cytophagales bacterium]|nr:hypothetical protein [Cytophagales bacterium]